MTEKHLDLLKKQLTLIDKNDFDLNGWKSSTTIILSRIFGDSYSGIKEVEKITYKEFNYFGKSSDTLVSCKKQCKDIIEACIVEINTYGQPEVKHENNSGIIINLNQTQNQTFKLKLIISALEDELTGTQLKELNELMINNDESSDKKNKILEKLKSFSGDVASNILANILTNPSIWG